MATGSRPTTQTRHELRFFHQDSNSHRHPAPTSRRRSDDNGTARPPSAPFVSQPKFARPLNGKNLKQLAIMRRVWIIIVMLTAVGGNMLRRSTGIPQFATDHFPYSAAAR